MRRRNGRRALGVVALGGHRGRCPDANGMAIGTKAVAHAAHQHGDVGTLPAAVGVEFVKD